VAEDIVQWPLRCEKCNEISGATQGKSTGRSQWALQLRVRYSYCAGGTIKGTRCTNTWSRRSGYSSDFVAPGDWVPCSQRPSAGHTFEPLTHFYHITLWSVLVFCFLPSYFIPQFSTSILFTFIFFSVRSTFPPLSSLGVSEGLVAFAVKLLPIIQVSPLSPHFLPFRGTCPVAGWGTWGEVSDDTQRLRCNSQIPQDTYEGSPLSNEVLCLHEAYFYLTTYTFFFPLNMPFSYCTN